MTTPTSGGLTETPLERILNDIGAAIWRYAKTTDAPFATQSAIIEQFEAATEGVEDADAKVQRCQEWLESFENEHK